MNNRFERGHRHIHVGWVRRNAVLARSKNSQTTVHSRDRRATRARFALVAWHIGSAEIHAARALQQIAGGGRHVSKLDRRTAEDRFGKNGVVFTNERVVSQIRVGDHSANC